MSFTAKDFIDSTEKDMKWWEEGLKEIQNGTFKYDDSMPKSCTNALYISKVKITKEVLEYLKSLNPNTIIQTNRGTTKEGSKYYELVNQ